MKKLNIIKHSDSKIEIRPIQVSDFIYYKLNLPVDVIMLEEFEARCKKLGVVWTDENERPH